MSNIMGEKIQLFIDGKTLACATSCAVEITSDDIDISCKDTGMWGATKRGKMSWNASSDNLMCVEDYSKLVDAMLLGTPVTLTFSTTSNEPNATADENGHVVPTGGSKATGDMYYGKVTISSISLTAGNGALATYTVKLNGVGALTKGADSASKTA